MSQNEYTYEDLSKKTVAQLREIASGIEHEALQGYTQLNKEHLLEAMCKALNIDMHVHHKVVGINKTQLKSQIRKLKLDRAAAMEQHDKKKLKEIRRNIHGLKRKLRRAMV